MMEVDKKKTRTDEAWVRLYARFETDRQELLLRK